METTWKKIQAGLLVCLCVLCLAGCSGSKGSTENKKGLSLYEKGQYAEAAAAFDAAISADGSCLDYYVNKCMAQVGQGDFAGARETMSQGLSLDMTDPSINRAAGIVCFEEGNYTEACNYFAAALNALGEDKNQNQLKKDIYLYKADAQIQSGAYEAAISDYTALIAMDEREPDYYLLRGKAYAALGSMEEAKADFLKIKELSPEEMNYYVEIYLTLEENSLAEEGKSYLETALSMKAKTSEDKKNRGAIQYLLGNYGEAKEELLSVKEEDRDENTWIYLGLSCEALGDSEGADEAYGKALSVTENQAFVYYQMGLLKMRLKDYSQALENIQAGLMADGGSMARELAYAEAACYEYLRDFQTALQKFIAYRDTYGSNEKIEHEIAFLETR